VTYEMMNGARKHAGGGWGVPPAGTLRVQLVRRDGRDVSTLYGREGGLGRPACWHVHAKKQVVQFAAPLALPPAAAARVVLPGGHARHAASQAPEKFLTLPIGQGAHVCPPPSVRLVRGEGRDVSD
jgi:hypothetical protein